MDYLISSTLKYFFQHKNAFSLTEGPPTLQKLDFGLCARVFSAVFLPLEPTIHFPTGQRFPLSNHVTSGCMSPRSLFSHWSAVSPSKSRDFRLPEPAIPFFTWSAVSHPTSGHDVTRPIRSLHFCHTVLHYYLNKTK